MQLKRPISNFEYTQDVLRTRNPKLSPIQLLDQAAIGMAGEAGEAAGHVGKFLYQGHDLDPDQFIDEMGDILYYMVDGAEVLGYTLEDIMRRNMLKRQARYPDGFDPARSRGRGNG